MSFPAGKPHFDVIESNICSNWGLMAVPKVTVLDFRHIMERDNQIVEAFATVTVANKLICMERIGAEGEVTATHSKEFERGFYSDIEQYGEAGCKDWTSIRKNIKLLEDKITELDFLLQSGCDEQ
ncbi:hypothetical protein GIB67_008444, partial [Kingdonia uniflora]